MSISKTYGFFKEGALETSLKLEEFDESAGELGKFECPTDTIRD